MTAVDSPTQAEPALAVATTSALGEHRSAVTSKRRWPPLLLAGLIAIAPFDVNLPSDGWTALYLRPLMLVSAAIAVVVLIGERRRLNLRLTLAAAGLVAAYGLSAAVSDGPMIGYSITVRIAVLALLFLAATVAFGPERDVRYLQAGSALGVALAATIGLVILANGSDGWGTSLLVGSISESRGVPRLTRPFSHANVAAMYLAPAGVLLAWAATKAKSHSAAAPLAAAALLASVAVSLTMSRAGLVAMSLGAILVPFALRRNKPRIGDQSSGVDGTATALSVAMIAILALPRLLWDRWDQRLGSIGSGAPKPLGRPEIWDQAFDAFASSPIAGVGPGRFSAYSYEATADGYAAAAHAHSPLFEVLATGGLVIAVAVAAFLYTAYRTVRHGNVAVGLLPWPAVAVTLVPMLVDNPFPFSSSANLVVLLAGAFVGLRVWRPST